MQDFQGQKLSEYLYYYIIIVCGAIGWVVGYAKGSFLLTFYGWFIGVIISLAVSGHGVSVCPVVSVPAGRYGREEVHDPRAQNRQGEGFTHPRLCCYCAAACDDGGGQVCCPDWPMFNKNPVDWLKEIPKPRQRPSQENLAASKGSKKA